MVPCKIPTITPFPFTSYPKIIAALVEPTYKVLSLQIEVANSICICGIILEHITLVLNVDLSRLKTRHSKAVNFQPVTLYFKGIVDTITLSQSELTTDGTIPSSLADKLLISSNNGSINQK